MIKSLFNKFRVSKVAKLNEKVENLLNKNELELLRCRKELTHCLDLMDDEVKRIQAQSRGYPQNSTSGGVWLDGVSLASMGEAIANHLSDKDFINEQAKATNIWTGAVLSVCSHYHHMVGPAMIANASISQKIGNIDYSKKAYSAVLQDFECILQYAEEGEYKPEGDDMVALNSLQVACEKLVELNELSGINSKAPEFLKRIAVAMGKPEVSDEDNNQ